MAIDLMKHCWIIPGSVVFVAGVTASAIEQDELGLLLTDARARPILSKHLPDLMSSPWLGQAMGFPLTRVGDRADGDPGAGVASR